MDAQYKLGIKLIDDEHSKLFGISQRLVDTAIDEAVLIAAELYEYVYTHFVHEEQLLKDWEHFEEHVGQHRQIMFVLDNTFEKLTRPMFIDPHASIVELRDLVDEWLKVHVIQQDAQYVSYLKALGYA